MSDDAVGVLAPVGDADWPDAVADMLGGFAGKLNVYRVMAHNPALLSAWSGLRGHVVTGGALTEQQKEIVILRTGHRWASSYEWAHHVSRGRLTGLSDFRIARTAAPSGDWGPESVGDRDHEEDIALLTGTDELLDDGRLSSPTRIRLAQFLTPAAILDVMATIGMYTTLAFIVNTHETPIDADVASQAPLA